MPLVRLLLPAICALAVAGAAGAATHGSDPLRSADWSLRAAHVPAAWRARPVRASPIVAVLDSGVDETQPDLRGAFVDGADLVGGPAGDINGHGTLVAGVVAARAGNGIGAAGVCPVCRVMPLRVVGANGEAAQPAIAAAVVWATDHGARVINMSFVVPTATPELADAVAYAQSRGVLLFAGAGNDGGTEAAYPAALPGVVGVAAVDAGRRLYDWSRRGSWVRVAAPGCAISTADRGRYLSFCGTSAATAFAAGVAGLLLAADPAARAEDLTAALVGTARPIDPQLSFGAVDAAAALERLLPRPPHKRGGPPKRASHVTAGP